MHKLYIVGSGIKFLSHLTTEVTQVIKSCDCVVYLVNEPATKRWIEENSKFAYSLDPIYFNDEKRINVYESICLEVQKISKNYETTCFVLYGHPFFLSNSSVKLVSDISNNSTEIKVEVLPGISSLDCLCCDLQIDISVGGLQAYEATDFLNKNYLLNPFSNTILWQIGVAGISTIIKNNDDIRLNKKRIKAISKLKEKLLGAYDGSHLIVFYIASLYPSVPPEIIKIKLDEIDTFDIPRLATAYISPCL